MDYQKFKQAKAIYKKPYKKDLTGKRFGRLVVVGYYGKKTCGNQKKSTWLCNCDCGNQTIVGIGELRDGGTQSCGCIQKEFAGSLNRTHNLSGKCGRLYPLWKSVKYRCYCKTSKDYANYGGRGIVMCDEWKNDFLVFYNWAISNGYKEEKTDKGLNILTLDRIDVNGNYEPSNCRFVTNAVQALNKRNTMSDSERYRECPVCKNKFKVSQRTSKQKTCSNKCGQLLRNQKNKIRKGFE